MATALHPTGATSWSSTSTRQWKTECGCTSPRRHTLLPHLAEDVRAATGLQDFVGTAPLNLVYVAHGERMTNVPPEDRRLYASVDTGFIGQNVYLFCASEGLASVFRAAVDYAKLTRLMRLPEQQFVTFAQTVGYPRG